MMTNVLKMGQTGAATVRVTMDYQPLGLAPRVPMSRKALMSLALSMVAPLAATFVELTIVLLRYGNFFTLRLPYPSMEVLGAVLAFGWGPAALVLALSALRDTRATNTNKPRRGRPYALAAMWMGLVWGAAVVLVMMPHLGGHDRHEQGRYSAQRSAKELADALALHAKGRDARLPNSLHALVTAPPGVDWFRLQVNHFRATYADRIPPGPAVFPDESSPTFAAELDAFSDYVYVGGDLPQLSRMGLDADHALILYCRYVHRPRDYVHVDMFTHQYTYDYEARVVVFASGRVVLVPTKDLAAVFDASDRQRTKWGLSPSGRP